MTVEDLIKDRGYEAAAILDLELGKEPVVFGEAGATAEIGVTETRITLRLTHGQKPAPPPEDRCGKGNGHGLFCTRVAGHAGPCAPEEVPF